MRLHGYWRSNATYRVRVALNLKGIAYEELEYDLLAGDQFAPAFLELNPNAAVPALETDGMVLTQSFAILDYLDTLPGGPRLLPEAPADRAEALALALNTVADAHPLIVPRVRKALADRFGADEEAVHDWARHWLAQGMAAYEQQFQRRRPAPYLFGDSLTVADICFASHCVASATFGVDFDATPTCKAYSAVLLEMPEFKAAHPLTRKAQL